MNVLPTEVLDFWIPRVGLLSPEQGRKLTPRWFQPDPDLDDQIRTRFGAAIEAAAGGRLEDWKRTPSGLLAWIILLDQFTRNAYRGSERQFEADPLALTAAREAIAAQVDQTLHPLDRLFLYLPLEHAEDMVAQEQSVALFRDLAESSGSWRDLMQGFLDYAIKHRDVIAKFGRFPHRNEMLERTSTPAELSFMAEHGRGF